MFGDGPAKVVNQFDILFLRAYSGWVPGHSRAMVSRSLCLPLQWGQVHQGTTRSLYSWVGLLTAQHLRNVSGAGRHAADSKEASAFSFLRPSRQHSEGGHSGFV